MVAELKKMHDKGENITFDGLVQDCSNSSALAMELLQSCKKPSTWCTPILQIQ